MKCKVIMFAEYLKQRNLLITHHYIIRFYLRFGLIEIAI